MNSSNNNSSLLLPDERGRFGDFGGRFVPETLTKALDQLAEQYQQAIEDPSFLPELDNLLHDYVGRPSALYHAERLSEICEIGRASCRERV